MKTLRRTNFLLFVAMVIIATVSTSCSKESEPNAIINVSTVANNSGDVKGNGGTATRTWKFKNSSSTTGWDMSINATSGSFQLVLKDAAGTTVLDKTLTAGVSSQSADGTTPSGTSGEWTATATLLNFSGSGDYSFR